MCSLVQPTEKKDTVTCGPLFLVYRFHPASGYSLVIRWQVCGVSFMSITMEDKEKHPLGPKAGDLTTQQQTQPSNRSQVNVRTEHAPPNAPVLDEVLLTTRLDKTTYADKE